MDATIWLWLGFAAFIGVLLAFDLGAFTKKAHAISGREALIRVGIYFIIAMIFCAGVLYYQGSEPALQFLSAYLIEYSLSIDNIFVIVLIFTHFAVPPQY
ncbi:TerC family protein, partial [Rubellimicrobium roseum]